MKKILLSLIIVNIGFASQFEKAINYYETANNYLEKNNKQKGIYYLKKSCELDYSKACDELANIYYDEKNKKLSKKFFEKACELGNDTACNELEELFN